MTDILAAAREKLTEHISPFLDRKALNEAGVRPSDLLRNAMAAAVSELSHDFVLTPRNPLLAVLNEREMSPTDPAALTNRVVVLEMALASARLR